MIDPSQNQQLKVALRYANGYRELGMHKEALAELAALPSEIAEHDAVNRMRLAVHMGGKTWKRGLPVAQLLADRNPDHSEDWVNLAYVARRARSIREAREILEQAAERFPKEAIIYYNLGCYACQQNEPERAKELLKLSFALDASYLELALEDSDLAELKDWIQSIRSA